MESQAPGTAGPELSNANLIYGQFYSSSGDLHLQGGVSQGADIPEGLLSGFSPQITSDAANPSGLPDSAPALVPALVRASAATPHVPCVDSLTPQGVQDGPGNPADPTFTILLQQNSEIREQNRRLEERLLAMERLVTAFVQSQARGGQGSGDRGPGGRASGEQAQAPLTAGDLEAPGASGESGGSGMPGAAGNAGSAESSKHAQSPKGAGNTPAEQHSDGALHTASSTSPAGSVGPDGALATYTQAQPFPAPLDYAPRGAGAPLGQSHYSAILGPGAGQVPYQLSSQLQSRSQPQNPLPSPGYQAMPFSPAFAGQGLGASPSLLAHSPLDRISTYYSPHPDEAAALQSIAHAGLPYAFRPDIYASEYFGGYSAGEHSSYQPAVIGDCRSDYAMHRGFDSLNEWSYLPSIGGPESAPGQPDGCSEGTARPGLETVQEASSEGEAGLEVRRSRKDGVVSPIAKASSKSAFKGSKPISQPPTWTGAEHRRFLEGLIRYGRSYTRDFEAFVQTRTCRQIRSHAQKYFQKVASINKEAESFNRRWGERFSGLRKMLTNLGEVSARMDLSFLQEGPGVYGESAGPGALNGPGGPGGTKSLGGPGGLKDSKGLDGQIVSPESPRSQGAGLSKNAAKNGSGGAPSGNPDEQRNQGDREGQGGSCLSGNAAEAANLADAQANSARRSSNAGSRATNASLGAGLSHGPGQTSAPVASQRGKPVPPLADPEYSFRDRCQIALRALDSTYTQIGKKFIELYKSCLGSHSDGHVFEKETQFPLSYLSEACKHMRSLFAAQWPDVRVDPAVEPSTGVAALRSLQYAARSIAGGLTARELAIAEVTHTVVRLYCSDQVTQPYVSFLTSSVFARYVSGDAARASRGAPEGALPGADPVGVTMVRFNAKVLSRLAEAYLTATLAGDPRDMEATMQVLETLRLFLTRTRDPLEYIIRNIHKTHKREAPELCALTFSVFLIDCSV